MQILQPKLGGGKALLPLHFACALSSSWARVGHPSGGPGTAGASILGSFCGPGTAAAFSGSFFDSVNSLIGSLCGPGKTGPFIGSFCGETCGSGDGEFGEDPKNISCSDGVRRVGSVASLVASKTASGCSFGDLGAHECQLSSNLDPCSDTRRQDL